MFANVLSEAVSLGIIDLTHLQGIVEMKKEDLYLKNHAFSIWQGKNGKWYTYLPSANGRRLVKKSSEEDLKAAIVSFYKEEDKKDSLTFIDVYHEWREFKDKLVDGNSVAKYETDERRYFTDPFFSRRIDIYIEDEIMVQIRTMIDEKKLCKSATKSLVGYIKNTFTFALRKGYIQKDPCAFITPKVFNKYCYASKRSAKSQVIERADIGKLNDIFKEDYLKRPWYMPTYAVEMASLTGMRVGELSALRWDHVLSDYILVDSSEKYKRKSKEYCVESTKNDKIRAFPLTDELKDLLRRIRLAQEEYVGKSEWIFADENGRIHAPVISSCIKNKCRMLGITERGIHAYRKTLNSAMRANGVPSVVAASIIGNSVEVNDKYYTYDVATIKEKSLAVSQALKVIKGNQAAMLG